jgi:hypothetical protein
MHGRQPFRPAGLGASRNAIGSVPEQRKTKLGDGTDAIVLGRPPRVAPSSAGEAAACVSLTLLALCR